MTTTTSPRPKQPEHPVPWRIPPEALTPSNADTVVQAGHVSWQHILARPCDAHHAAAGAPCWSWGPRIGGTTGAVCKARVRAACPRRKRKGASRR